jgi:hypothetical protein
VNIATQDDEEMVSFRAGRFDRARGATICTLNLPDELASHAVQPMISRRMTEWRLPPPGSAEAGHAGQPRIFPRIHHKTGDVLAGAGRQDACGVTSGPI